MSNTCWAFAKLGCKAETLFAAIADQHKRLVGSGDVQALSNTCWSFAKLDCKADVLFEAVAGQHAQIVSSGNTLAMSNTCWAFAKLDCKAYALFEGVAGQHKKLASGDVQVLRNLCWAFAKTGNKVSVIYIRAKRASNTYTSCYIHSTKLTSQNCLLALLLCFVKIAHKSRFARHRPRCFSRPWRVSTGELSEVATCRS